MHEIKKRRKIAECELKRIKRDLEETVFTQNETDVFLLKKTKKLYTANKNSSTSIKEKCGDQKNNCRKLRMGQF